MNVCFKRIKQTKSTKRKRKATMSWRELSTTMLWEVWATMWGGSVGDILYCWPRTLSRPNRWCDSIGTGSNYGKRNQVHPSDQSIALVDQDGHIWRLQFHSINCHMASINIVIIIIVLSHTTYTFFVLFLIKLFLTIKRYELLRAIIWTVG